MNSTREELEQIAEKIRMGTASKSELKRFDKLQKFGYPRLLANARQGYHLVCGASRIELMALSPNGRIVATAGFRPITLFDVSRSGFGWRGQIDEKAFALAFDVTSKRLLFGNKTHIHTVDVKTFKEVSAPIPIPGRPKALVCTEDIITVAGAFGIQVNHGGHITTLDAGTVRTLAWFPGGERLAAGTEDGEVQVWTWPDGNCVAKAKLHDRLYHLDISADGQTIVTMGNCAQDDLDSDHTVNIVAASDLGVRHSLQVSPDFLATRPRKNQVVISCGRHRHLNLFDLATGNELAYLGSHDDMSVEGIAFQPTGKLMVSGSFQGGELMLTELAAKRALGRRGTVTGLFDATGAFRLSNDVILFSVDNDGYTAVRQAVWDGHYQYPSCLLASDCDADDLDDYAAISVPDRLHRSIVVLADTGALWFSNLTGRPAQLTEEDAIAIMTARGSRLAAVGNDGVLRRWDAVTSHDAMPLVERDPLEIGDAQALAFCGTAGRLIFLNPSGELFAVDDDRIAPVELKGVGNRLCTTEKQVAVMLDGNRIQLMDDRLKQGRLIDLPTLGIFSKDEHAEIIFTCNDIGILAFATGDRLVLVDENNTPA